MKMKQKGTLSDWAQGIKCMGLTIFEKTGGGYCVDDMPKISVNSCPVLQYKFFTQKQG